MDDDHPIFDDIERGDLVAVQQRVLADTAVLEERESYLQRTPLMWATQYEQPAMALWIIRHRGQHDLESADEDGWTALQYASANGLLEVVQALVAAGANPAVGATPLLWACCNGHTDIVAFLQQLPAVKATIDAISSGQYPDTALSLASYHGDQPIVRLLLDAGADPTIPAGEDSPLSLANLMDCPAIAALLRHVIDEAERFHALHKARSLLGAGAASLACLQGRVEQGQALPVLEFPPQQQQQQQQQEKLRATAAFAVGVSGGEKDTGLCEDLYTKLQGYMLPRWADEGPDA